MGLVEEGEDGWRRRGVGGEVEVMFSGSFNCGVW